MSNVDPGALAEIEAALAESGVDTLDEAPFIGVPAPRADPETGEEQRFAASRTDDWGYETRSPGGGLSYQERRYGQVVEPTYREGDQFDIYGLTPPEIASLQRNLIAAGLLSPDDVQAIGYVGPAGEDATFAAFEQAMAYANQAGYTSVDHALIALQSGRYGQGPGGRLAQQRGGGSGRLPAQISNADDLRRVFKAAVIDTLGRGASESDIDRMVANYQAMESERAATAEQMALEAAMSGAESSGTLESLPDPTTFALSEARKSDPTGAQAHDFLGAANSFLGLLGQWNPPAGELPS